MSNKMLLKKGNTIAVYFSDKKYYVGKVLKSNKDKVKIGFYGEGNKQVFKIKDIKIYPALISKKMKAGLDKKEVKKIAVVNAKSKTIEESKQQSAKSKQSKVVDIVKTDMVIVELDNNEYYTAMVKRVLRKYGKVTLDMHAFPSNDSLNVPIDSVIGKAERSRKTQIPRDRLESYLLKDAKDEKVKESSVSTKDNLIIQLLSLTQKQIKEILLECSRKSSKFEKVLNAV